MENSISIFENTTIFDNFYTQQIINKMINYIVNKSTALNPVPYHSPLNNFIFELSKNLPTVDPETRKILNAYILDSFNLPDKISNIPIAPNKCLDMTASDKNYINFYIFKYIELNFSTNLTNEILNIYKQIYPHINKLQYIGDLNTPYVYNTDIIEAKKYLKTMLEFIFDKKYIIMPENVDKQAYFRKLLKTGEILLNEFKMRESYLCSLNKAESQQYFIDLIIKYKYKLVNIIENVPNPNVNKSKILEMLGYDYYYNFNDFFRYDWEQQVKNYLWSLQDKPSNTKSFRCSATDFSVISETFLEAKNNELAKLSQDPSHNINAYPRIGNNKYIRAIPKNYLVGILYDDTLNSANIKFISKASEIL